MTCYVDDVRLPYGNMIMCHLWADTTDELLAMVDRIGVNRKWIQGHSKLSRGKAKKASWVHFDICASKKRLALENGAKLTDKYGPAEHEARSLAACTHPATRAKGEAQLLRIANCRATAIAGAAVAATRS